MKKFVKGLTKVLVAGSILLGSAFGIQITTDVLAAGETNNKQTGINQIENEERNVFSQYFEITKLDDAGADVVNRYNSNDTYYINKQDFDLDFATLEIGEKIVVTFDHDTTIDAVRDMSYKHQYKLYEGKDWNVDLDESKYVYGVNFDNEFDTVVLEKGKYKAGDIVDVVYNNDKGDDIKSIKKIGMFDIKEDSFKVNAENDPNKDNPNYVQTEDGSYVPKDFWK